MIQINKNQIVPENPNLRVLSSSGDYGDNDLIECSTLDNPDFALCAFSSSFIKYGNVINQFNDPLELGKKLFEIDPDATHDTVTLFKEEEARRIKREGGDFTPENPVEIDEEKIKEEEETTSEETPKETPEATTPESTPEETPSSTESPTPTESEQTPVPVVDPVPTEPAPVEPEVLVPETPPTETETPTPIEVIVDTVKTVLE